MCTPGGITAGLTPQFRQSLVGSCLVESACPHAATDILIVTGPSADGGPVIPSMLPPKLARQLASRRPPRRSHPMPDHRPHSALRGTAPLPARTPSRVNRTGPAVQLRNGRLVRVDNLPAEPAPKPPAPVPALANSPAQTANLSLTRKLSILVFVATLFLPSLYNVGSIKLSPSLLFLIVSFPITLGWWATGRAGLRSIVDILVLAFALWAATTRFFLLDPGAAIEPAGVVLLQSAGAYFAGRALVRDASSMRFTFAAAIIAVLLMTPFLIWESVSGTKPLLDLASRFGQTLAPTYMEERWGFSRAQGVFEHPILLGVFCATLLAPAIYIVAERSSLGLRGGMAAIVALATLTSLSTGALLSMNAQIALVGWNGIFRRVQRRWIILIYLLAALFVITDLLSDRTPFHLFVDYATFNTQNSYNRILIWEFGTADVMRSPFIGHGTDDWERPAYMSNSMDNFWLVIAYRHGLIGLALLLGAFALTIVRVARAGAADDGTMQIRRGYIFALVATMVAIVSLHLWNNSYIWLMFVLGAGGWLQQANGLAKAADLCRKAAAAPRERGHSSPILT